MIPKNKREWFAWVAMSYIGKWYKWGGDDPSAWDCSGLFGECAKSVGLVARGVDMTARDYYRSLGGAPNAMTPEQAAVVAQLGDAVFYSHEADASKIHHVEICLGDGLTIGASGGGSTTLTIADAIAQNAFVKVRPLAGAGRPRFCFVLRLFT